MTPHENGGLENLYSYLNDSELVRIYLKYNDTIVLGIKKTYSDLDLSKEDYCVISAANFLHPHTNEINLTFQNFISQTKSKVASSHNKNIWKKIISENPKIINDVLNTKTKNIYFTYIGIPTEFDIKGAPEEANIALFSLLNAYKKMAEAQINLNLNTEVKHVLIKKLIEKTKSEKIEDLTHAYKELSSLLEKDYIATDKTTDYWSQTNITEKAEKALNPTKCTIIRLAGEKPTPYMKTTPKDMLINTENTEEMDHTLKKVIENYWARQYA